ncbi:hypothetical protein BASA81_003081 [Batrachochytrium salamandrivorans]|nr:hypothetical protein BASA81_003081 [Batrachochytrium salamandrivorans]
MGNTFVIGERGEDGEEDGSGAKEHDMDDHSRYAAQEEHPKLLLNPSSSASAWEQFPLHHAAACGAPIAELSRLVEAGCDVDDIHDESGSTPLHFAAMYGQETVVRWFLKQRRMLSRHQPIRDFHGLTASDVAKQCGFPDLAEVIGFHQSPALSSGSSSSILPPSSSSSSTIIMNKSRQNDNALLQEIDRGKSTIAKLKASEKRVRMELEQEIAERIKLFRSLVRSHDNQQPVVLDVTETMSDMRLQMVEFKAQRDALAAELKLVEDAIGDLELYITGSSQSTSPSTCTSSSPSQRLKSCLRRI